MTGPTTTRLNLPFVVKGEDRSCANCPSAVSTEQQRSAIGSTVNAPICTALMKPVMNPDAVQTVQRRQLETHAKTCTRFGVQAGDLNKDAFTAAFEFEVAFPKPNTIVTDDDIDSGMQRARAGNCNGCTNYVPSGQVKTMLGYQAGLCLAKGTLLLEDRLGAYANGCEHNERFNSSRRPTLDGLVLFPEHSRTFGVIDPFTQSKRMREINPVEWLSDASVTDADRANGIRAWRRIDDPNGYAEACYLPIFRTDYHDDRDNLIPTFGCDEHPENFVDYGGFVWQIVVAWTKLRMTPIMWGMPGVGKTEIFRYMAFLMNSPFTRISFTNATELDDIAGKMMYHPERGTYYHMGRLTSAFTKPGVGVLDEPNTSPDSIWQFIRPALDSRKLVIDANVGDEHKQHKNFFLGLAANQAWDPRNVGTNEIGDADARRLLHVNMGLPSEPVERQIIKTWCASLDDGFDPTPHLDAAMKVAREIRELSADGTINMTWGLANNVKTLRMMQHFPPHIAYGMAVLNYLDPEACKLVMESVKSNFPA